MSYVDIIKHALKQYFRFENPWETTNYLSLVILAEFLIQEEPFKAFSRFITLHNGPPNLAILVITKDLLLPLKISANQYNYDS